MYTFACKDLGMDCAFETKANTIDDIKKSTMAHAEKAHKDFLMTLTTPEKKADFEKSLTKVIKSV
jgi:predicted small metal-binding protein